jgi:hypothetical protein
MKSGPVVCEVDEQELQELLDGSRDSIDFWFEDINVQVKMIDDSI